MNQRISALALGAMLFALCFSAQAQQPGKVPTIGYLGNNARTRNPEAFRQGLRDLGYIEGQNVGIEYRYAEGKPALIPTLAAELVRLNVDVILVAGGTQAVLPVKRATNSIPSFSPLWVIPLRAGL